MEINIALEIAEPVLINTTDQLPEPEPEPESPLYIVHEYTEDTAWTKPESLRGLAVLCIAAGGGGGSGRRGAPDTARSGGGGGGGGAIVIRSWLDTDPTTLPETGEITIGIGGAGGDAITVDDTNGNPGTAGGNTSFGDMVIAKGGNAGGGGTNAGSNGGGGGHGSLCTPGFANNMLPAGTGIGAVVAGIQSAPYIGMGFQVGTSGGSAGGTIKADNEILFPVNTPGTYDKDGVLQGVISGGTEIGADGINGADNVGIHLFNQTTNSIFSKGVGAVGSGGVSGDAVGIIPGGTGGNGGLYGIGGSGGGGSTNGANSGAGGNGGNGLCIVVEFY